MQGEFGGCGVIFWNFNGFLGVFVFLGVDIPDAVLHNIERVQ